MRDRFIQSYFDRVYTPAYDVTTACFAGYRGLLERSLSRLMPGESQRILCVGVGTGNEVEHLLRDYARASIVGVDLSRNALKTAQRRASQMGREIETLVMDARRLVFPDASFDKVVCIHVMDFIDRPELATREIFRVLREGGEFVITYPSKLEGNRLLTNLIKRDICTRMSRGQTRVPATLASLGHMFMGIVYLPILMRAKPPAYSDTTLKKLLETYTSQFEVEEYPDYCDFIAYGHKLRR